jgi:hypothetical protein
MLQIKVLKKIIGSWWGEIIGLGQNMKFRKFSKNSIDKRDA